MNGFTHEEYAKAAARLILANGFAPSAAEYLQEGRGEFVSAASLPDRVNEVACAVPGAGPRTELLGHGLSSFEHFQIFQRGYRWHDDQSLSLGATGQAVAKVLELLLPVPGLGAIAGAAADLSGVTTALSRVAGMQISMNAGGAQPPLAGITRDSPMQAAVALQPGFSLGSFCFPSAASMASYYAIAAQRWTLEQNAAGWRQCAGYACHFVQDCCVPHHAWGVLLMGHSNWEDALQAAWHETFVEVLNANLFGSTVAHAVSRELSELAEFRSLAELCEANAAWAVSRFGDAHELRECPGDVALRVSIRAVAASVRACELMTGG